MGDTRGDGSILSVSSRALLGACEGLGIDTAAMLRSAEVDRATVEDPDGRIPSYKVAKLWEQAYALSGDPQLALHAIERLPFGAYKVIDFLAWNAPTMGEGVRKVCEYFPIINPAVELSLEVGDDRVTMTTTAQSHVARRSGARDRLQSSSRGRRNPRICGPESRHESAYTPTSTQRRRDTLCGHTGRATSNECQGLSEGSGSGDFGGRILVGIRGVEFVQSGVQTLDPHKSQ
jgi:hypothetical protein